MIIFGVPPGRVVELVSLVEFQDFRAHVARRGFSNTGG